MYVFMLGFSQGETSTIAAKIFMEKFVTAFWYKINPFAMSDALRDLVSFVQFKKRKNSHRGVLLLVTWECLLANFALCTIVTCKFTKSNVPPWGSFTLFKLY